ncbi:MAG: ABC transporter permease, partial [Phycisphaerae bacterium]|nr:ABC transporter permease [Phycisphaerae bacterium]
PKSPISTPQNHETLETLPPTLLHAPGWRAPASPINIARVYKLFLTIRYLRKRRIAYFAIAAVTLCVAMVLIVMSVMQGFLDNVKNRARGLLGDVIVDNRDFSGFPLYEEFINDVSQWPEVVRATPVIYSYGLIRFPRTSQSGTVQVVGIRLSEIYEVNSFKDGLYYETHYPGTTTFAERGQPVLGIELAPGEAGSGDRFRVYPTLPEPFASALEKSRAAGIVDEDKTKSDINDALKEVEKPLIPGLLAVAPLETENEPQPAFIGDPWPGLIIGRDIVARRLSDGTYERYYDNGERVQVTLLQVSPSGSIDTPIKQPFRYVDDSRTGIYEIDSQHVYCDFDLLQKLLMMEETELVDGGIAHARCSQIQMKIMDSLDYTARQDLTRRLQAHYMSFLDDSRFKLDLLERRLIQRVKAMTWEESQANIIAPVEKERVLVTILFGVISMVAVVLVLCILYMIVLQKTRDIGIVKAIGGSSAGVAMIFISYGAAVGLVGATLGTVGGYFFVTHINEFQEFITKLNPAWQVWDRAVYSFDEIPHQVNAYDMITVYVSAVIASALGSLLAAWRAGSMHPVEALRYE